MKTNIIIFLVSAGVDQGIAQIVPRGWKNEMKENSGTQALIRKYTAGLVFDTQVPLDMGGYYHITSRMLDSLALVLQSEVNKEYQVALTQNLSHWSEANNRADNRVDDTFSNLEMDYQNGLLAVETLKNMARKMRFKNRTLHKFCFLPVRCAADAIEYGRIHTSRSGGVNLNNMRLGVQSQTGQYALYTDVYTDYFGPVSAGVGALVGLGGSKDENSDSFNQTVADPAAINRLVSGGGNVVIHLTYPLASWQMPEHKMDFRIKLHPRLGLDLPNLGSNATNYAMNLDCGIYGTFTYMGLNENIGVVAEFKVAGITGNQSFFRQLDPTVKDVFNLNQLSLGLKLGRSFQITWMRFWGSLMDKETQPAMLSFSMSME